MYSEQGYVKPYLLNTMQLKRNIKNNKLIYSVRSKEVEKEDKDQELLNKYPLLQEFKVVFLNDFIESPPQREFDFLIDLVPGVKPIAQSSYKINTIKMQELKVLL